MLQQDYLVRMLTMFAEAIRRSLEKSRECDPRGAAEMLEAAIGDATDIDGSVLLSLTPESIASIMMVSGVDPRVTEYIARSLKLEATYLADAGEAELAQLRSEQADAVAAAYGLGEIDIAFDELDGLDGSGGLDSIGDFGFLGDVEA